MSAADTHSTPSGPHPPRSVTVAVVFAYLESALLVFGGLFVVASGWIASRFLGPSFGRWFTVIGVVIVVVGALYVVAARRLRTGSGRVLLTVLAVITVVAQLTSAVYGDLTVGPLALLLVGLVPPVGAFVAAVQVSARQWIASHRH